jgi:hypothetical protein
MNKAGSLRWLWIAVFLVIGWALGADAAVILLAGRMEGDVFKPAGSSASNAVGCLYYAARATVDGDRARTSIEVTARVNGEGMTDVVCVIPLPADLTIHGPAARVTADGQARPLTVTVLAASKAQALYEAVAEAHRRPAILACAGKPALCIPLMGVGRKTEIAIEFEQDLRKEDGLLVCVCPMPDTALSGEPVDKVAFNATVRQALPIRSVMCTTHAVRVDRPGLREVSVESRAEKYTGSEDLVLRFVADRDPLGLRVVTHRTRDDDEGFFMLLASPTGSEKPEPAIPKDMVFVRTSAAACGARRSNRRALPSSTASTDSMMATASTSWHSAPT